MVPPHTEQSVERQPIGESSPFVGDTALLHEIQRAPQLFDAASIVRHLVQQAAALGQIRVIHVAGHGQVLALPDGDDASWFVVLGTCGHVSGFLLSPSDAVRWRCEVCEALKVSDIHANQVLSRLQHVRSMAETGLAHARPKSCGC